ncbi:hypothetical protein DITRI_Ditri06bG0117000 [Diplodiscus trichospermus]
MKLIENMFKPLFAKIIERVETEVQDSTSSESPNIDRAISFYSLVLLKPIVSQLVIEPPSSIEEHLNIPSVNEVDDLLVICIGQMAVIAGIDLLWKPLNHEVI